jgi:hypothetical protein
VVSAVQADGVLCAAECGEVGFEIFQLLAQDQIAVDTVVSSAASNSGR